MMEFLFMHSLFVHVQYMYIPHLYDTCQVSLIDLLYHPLIPKPPASVHASATSHSTPARKNAARSQSLLRSLPPVRIASIRKGAYLAGIWADFPEDFDPSISFASFIGFRCYILSCLLSGDFFRQCG